MDQGLATQSTSIRGRRLCAVWPHILILLICSESIGHRNQSKVRSHSARDNIWLESPFLIRHTQPIDEPRLMSRCALGFKGESIKYAADENECRLTIESGFTSNCCGFDCWHLGSHDRLLSRRIVREQSKSREPSRIGMTAGIAVFVLPGASCPNGMVQVNRNDVFPRKDIYRHSLTDIFLSYPRLSSSRRECH